MREKLVFKQWRQSECIVGGGDEEEGAEVERGAEMRSAGAPRVAVRRVCALPGVGSRHSRVKIF